MPRSTGFCGAFWLVVAILLTQSSPAPQAVDEGSFVQYSSPQALIRLPSLRVIVEERNPDVDSMLFADTFTDIAARGGTRVAWEGWVQTDMETGLRYAGFVIEPSNAFTMPKTPQARLLVIIDMERNPTDTFRAYSVGLQSGRIVSIDSSPTPVLCCATAWTKNLIGTVRDGPNLVLRDAAKRLVRDLIKNLLKVNQLKPWLIS